MKKIYILVYLLSSLITTNAMSKDIAFEQLPFGIKVGKTLENKVKDKALCVDEVKYKETLYHCREYDFGGNFTVFISQDGIVTKVQFLPGNRLPRNWRKLGLNLDPDQGKYCVDFNSCDESMGNNPYTVRAVLTNGNIEYKEKQKGLYSIITFELGNNYYEFTFWETPEAICGYPEDRCYYLDGVHSIIVTESY